MAALKEKAVGVLLGSASVTMNSAASTTLFTVPTGKFARITAVVIRDPTASLAGLTSASFTQWMQNVDLSQATTANTSYTVITPPVSGPTLLGVKAAVNMQAGAGPTTIYTTPAGTVTRISGILVKDPSATLASGTSFKFGTGFRNDVGVDLSSMTTANTDFMYLVNGKTNAGADVKCTEIAASTAVAITNTTGSAGAATATIEIYGFQEPPNVFTELAAATNFQITINTAATAAGTATIDVFGYLSN